MTFDAIMFLAEAERFITFNGTCKVNLVFNFRLPSKEKNKKEKTKTNHSDIFHFL